MKRTSITLPALCLAVAACGGGSTDGSGGGDTIGDCNALANIGQVIAETADGGPVPTMTGGTIADGIYVLTSNVQYAGSSADSRTHRRTIQIAGNSVQIVNSDDGAPDVHATLELAPSGNALDEMAVCPPGLVAEMGTYTATATSLAILKNGTNQVETYTKQ
ncbi:Hypothetical protein A7982_03145 [Minicystis rosea]|nr:Hypothetical protein A7982_03145 [Minicystis rosea]